MKIFFSNKTKFKFKKSFFANLIDKLQKTLKLPQKIEIGIFLVSPTAITKINQAILKRKGTTDVISVSASINKDELVGDIFICPKIAQKSAQKEKHSLKKEIKILTAHAILHLLGLDHEKKKTEWQKFWQKAEKVIK